MWQGGTVSERYDESTRTRRVLLSYPGNPRLVVGIDTVAEDTAMDVADRLCAYIMFAEA